MLEWNVRGGNGLKPHKVPRNIDNVLVTMDPGVDQRIEWGAGEFRPREVRAASRETVKKAGPLQSSR
jgi:hypothetical protein